jgi:nucleotide-binding universal stress UspA family protein
VRVLLALDGSPSSLLARDLVASLPWADGTIVHLVAACQLPIDLPVSVAGRIGGTAEWIDDAEDSVRSELDEQLAGAAGPLVTSGLAVERVVARGRPADVIAEVASRIGADLVVTGSRGRGPLASMLLGSVANEVAFHAPCSVLVVRADHVSRVLVATDSTSGARRIGDWLEETRLLRGIPADVVAVSIPDDSIFELGVRLYTLGDERLARKRIELRERYRADAEAMAERLTSIGMPASALLRAGDPAHQILAAADERGADLIAVGSRDLEGVERLLLGSVARNVLVHAHCSVLIVRDRRPVTS